MSRLVLSDKYKAFLRCQAPVEFLEGTTLAGKTTVALFKFILRCIDSPKSLHILSGLDLGTIEKNIITKDLGILDDFGDLAEYNPCGRGVHSLPHIVLHGPGGPGRGGLAAGGQTGSEKIIYVLGYDNKARWKKALGGQYGCVYIDEINVADIDFVREASIRCDYLLATLNPDDPDLPVYRDYIDHSRPLPEWERDTPPEILQALCRDAKPGWVHWFFSFDHNDGLTTEKIEQVKRMAAPGTKLYKNKVQGLRGRAEGLVFQLEERHLITGEEARGFNYALFTAGLDTAYSQNSADTFAMTFWGVTACGRLVCLDTLVYNNRDLAKPLTPSDVPVKLDAFLEANRAAWGFARDVFIDSADQATILECQKHKRTVGSIYNYLGAWKKTKIIDRIHLQAGWMASGRFLLVRERCGPLIDELNAYTWKPDKYEPEDGHDHCINSGQYAWLPFKDKIGNRISG